MNGCELYDVQNDKHYEYYKLEKAWIKEILELMRPFNLKPYLYDGNEILGLMEDEQMRRSAKKACKTLRVCQDEAMLYAKDNAKIMFRLDPKDMEMIEAFVKKLPNENYQAFKTQPGLIGFGHKRFPKVILC